MGISQDQIQILKDDIRRDGIQKVVVGAVIHRNGLILLLKRRGDDFMGGLVELPSGTVDSGEAIIDALKREVREETGLEIDDIDSFIGTFDYTSGSGKKTRQLNFLIHTDKQEIKLNPEEHTESYWLDPGSDAFKTLKISAETIRTIQASRHS